MTVIDRDAVIDLTPRPATHCKGWQHPKPSSIGDFVEGCAAAFAERGVK